MSEFIPPEMRLDVADRLSMLLDIVGDEVTKDIREAVEMYSDWLGESVSGWMVTIKLIGLLSAIGARGNDAGGKGELAIMAACGALMARAADPGSPMSRAVRE